MVDPTSVVNDGSNRQGHKTHQGPMHVYRGVPWMYKREGKGQGKLTWCGERKKTSTTVVVKQKQKQKQKTKPKPKPKQNKTKQNKQKKT